MQLVSSSTFLTDATPPGLFRSLSGCRFWVFDTVHGRVAVQLDEEGFGPQFAYFYLSDDQFIEGHWTSSVWLGRGPKSIAAPKGHCGIIRTFRGLVYFKANNPRGQGDYLRVLGYRDNKAHDYSLFSHHWRLLTNTYDREFEFFEQIKNPPRMRRYWEDAFETW